jgi:hypothetical protein
VPERDITPEVLDDCISEWRSTPGTRREPLMLQHTSELQDPDLHEVGDLEAQVDNLSVA